MKYTIDLSESARKNADKKLNSLYLKVTNSGKIKCDVINKNAIAIDFIIDFIEKKKPDIVIMGTQGASGIKEMFMGSNAAKVIEKAKCPVIVIPEKTKFKAIKKITYATDYKQSDMNALKKIVEIGELFGAKITLLHVYNDELTFETEELLMDKFKAKIEKKMTYDKFIFKLIFGINFIKILEEYIKIDNPDLIATSTKYRNLFDKIFMSSSTKKIACHTKIPLMAFHYKKESVLLF
jgi:nucleotide-binding universal stress UspA family protein